MMLYVGCVNAQSAKLPKKLIEYGWDIPTTDFVKQNVRQMELRPFDGVVIKLKAGSSVFRHKPLDPKEFAQDLENLQTTNYSKFTDNFVLMWATTDKGWDWFSDSDWEASEQNIALFAKTARAGWCVGIAFDPETYKQYGVNPWIYSNLPHAKEKSFSEYWQQVRKRGAQFTQALEQEIPGVKVLTFFQLSYLSEFLDEPDSVKRMRQLSRADYGLLPAFLNGMLDVAQPNTAIVDGNENAYYYAAPESFSQGYNLIRQRALALIEPKNRRKYALQVQAGHALYIDQLFGLRKPQKSFLSYYLTQQERAKWLEHNTYYALLTSDEYVWCYSEEMNWWTSKVPAGVQEAIESARQKIKMKLPLGFNIQEMLQKAEKKLLRSKRTKNSE